MMLLAPIISLGMPASYLHIFKNDENDSKEELFNFQLTLILLANVLLMILCWIGLPLIESIFVDESPEYNQYIFVSLLILLFYSTFLQLNAFSVARLNTVFPEFIRNVYLRIGNMILIILYGMRIINLEWMLKSLVIVYGTAFLINLIFIFKRYNFLPFLRLKKLSGKVKKEIIRFGGTMILVSLGGTLANQFFFLMIASFLGLGANGIFTTCFYIATVIEMPKRSMMQIIIPIFSNEFKNQGYTEIGRLYKKSSLTLSVIAGLIFLGVISNLDDLFMIIPNGETFETGKMVVILISLSKMIDLVFGFNSELINYSPYYRYTPLFSLSYGVVTAILSFLLIPSLGIEGAGYAFLISIIVYNAIKFYFLNIKYKITPFTIQHLYLVMLSLVVYFVVLKLPLALQPLPRIIIKSVIITLLYGAFVYFLKISVDINNLTNQLIRRVFKSKS